MISSLLSFMLLVLATMAVIILLGFGLLLVLGLTWTFKDEKDRRKRTLRR